MAISVSIPKEITEYEEKIIFGLSLRKLIFLVVAVVLAVGTGLLCTMIIGFTIETTGYIIIIEAMPLMALGFIKKDGMAFEKYFALILRHKIGTSRLIYKTELVLDDMPGVAIETSERKSKYAWVFESKKSSSTDTKLREYSLYEITRESRKRKVKAARLTVKAARKECRTAKRRAKKAFAINKRTKNHPAAGQI